MKYDLSILGSNPCSAEVRRSYLEAGGQAIDGAVELMVYCFSSVGNNDPTWDEFLMEDNTKDDVADRIVCGLEGVAFRKRSDIKSFGFVRGLQSSIDYIFISVSPASVRSVTREYEKRGLLTKAEREKRAKIVRAYDNCVNKQEFCHDCEYSYMCGTLPQMVLEILKEDELDGEEYFSAE